MRETAHRPDVDGLRAVAIVAVIANHFERDLLPSGFLGVDVFFVISGYVITSSLARRPNVQLGDFLLAFYLRRIKRLVPALVLCVLVTSLLISLFSHAAAPALRTGVWSLFAASNFYLWGQATDYFGALAERNVFTHTWTLGVEEQFYFTFPLMAWLSGLGRRPGAGRRQLAWVLGALGLASLWAFFRFGATQPAAAFYLMPMRLWELGVGCLVSIAPTHAEPRAPSDRFGASPLVAAVVLAAALFVPDHHSLITTVVVVACTGWLIASLQSGDLVHRALTHPRVVGLGLISYSLYLWHWPVIVLSRWTIGIHWWSAPFQLGLMLLLAMVSYRFVERPLRHAEWSRSAWRSVGYGLGASAAVAAVVAGMALGPPGTLYLGTEAALAAKGVETLTAPYALSHPPSSWSGEPCVLADNGEVGKAIPIERCTLGSFTEARRRVLVVGNSYSTTFVQAFDSLVQRDDHAVTVTSSWGAPPVPEVPLRSSWQAANRYYWDQVVPDLIANLQGGDLVLLISDVAFLTPDPPTSESARQLDALEQGLSRLSARLADRGIGLAMLNGLGFAREAKCDPDTAAPQWFAPFGGPCRLLSRAETLARRAPLDARLSSLEARGTLTVVDLTGVFCPSDTCPYFAPNGDSLYRDVYAHPSVEAARLSAPIVRQTLLGIPPLARSRLDACPGIRRSPSSPASVGPQQGAVETALECGEVHVAVDTDVAERDGR